MGVEETSEELEEFEEVDEDEFIESLSEEGDSDEDVRETAERAARALLGEDEEESSEEEPEEAAEEPSSTVNQSIDEVAAPERFSAAAKEAWSKTPAEVRKEFPKMIRDMQGHFTRKLQEVTGKQREAAGILEAIKPFEKEWAARGVNRGQAVAALAYDYHLKVTDPKRSIAETARRAGIDLFDLAEEVAGGESGRSQGSQGHVDISQHPQFIALQNQTQQLNNYIGQQRQAAVQADAKGIAEEIRSLRQERNPDGSQRFPAMNNPEFFKSVKPLVSNLRRISPGLSWAEAFRRAYFTLEGYPQGDSSNGNQAGLPPGNNQPKARPISVRGASAPGPGTFKLPDASEIPDDTRGAAELAVRLIEQGYS